MSSGQAVGEGANIAGRQLLIETGFRFGAAPNHLESWHSTVADVDGFGD